MFCGKYRLLATLGSGGMGTVYKVHQVFLDKDFALKTMDNRAVSDVAIQRFQQEAKAAALLNHPNLVHVHDFGLLDDDQPYLVMDLVDGVTFAEYLKLNGPLPVEHVASFFAPACFGLLAAHDQGLVHRDIKPGNIMVVTGLPLGAEQRIKVVDFGIAKFTGRDAGEIQALTATGEIFGSPLYMSPEQCTGGIIDHRSDIYSMGCVLFEMLTGTPPYFGQSALSTMMLHESGKPPTLKEASLGTDFPEALEHAVAKMLRRAPSERYQNIGLVATDLAAICKGGSIAIRGSTHEESRKKAGKEITISAVKLYILLAVTASVSSVIAWFGGAVFRQTQSQTSTSTSTQTSTPTLTSTPTQTSTPTPTPTPTPPSPSPPTSVLILNEKPVSSFPLSQGTLERDRKEIEMSGPIKATIVGPENAKQRTYVFPQCGIGTLLAYDPQNPLVEDRFVPQDFICKAQGSISVPISRGDLALSQMGGESVAAIKTPSIYSKISGKEFRKLFMSNSMDEYSMEMNQSQRTAQAQNMAEIMANLSGWSGLESLGLKQCILRTKSFDRMNKLVHLQNLILDKCDFDARELAAQPFLMKLKVLNLTALGDGGDQVVLQLSRSSTLHTLRLIVLSNSISPSSIEQLKHCPSLHKLIVRFKNTPVDDQMLKAISKLETVKKLELLECTLGIPQIRILSMCRGPDLIVLSASNYPSTQLKALIKQIDPRFVFK